jgi:hypothetical protein
MTALRLPIQRLIIGCMVLQDIPLLVITEIIRMAMIGTADITGLSTLDHIIVRITMVNIGIGLPHDVCLLDVRGKYS